MARGRVTEKPSICCTIRGVTSTVVSVGRGTIIIDAKWNHSVGARVVGRVAKKSCIRRAGCVAANTVVWIGYCPDIIVTYWGNNRCHSGRGRRIPFAFIIR